MFQKENLGYIERLNSRNIEHPRHHYYVPEGE